MADGYMFHYPGFRHSFPVLPHPGFYQFQRLAGIALFVVISSRKFRLYPELVETPSDWYMQRTAWNVRDSHCTLIVCAGGIEPGSGTEATVEFARDYGRPWMVAEGPADADHVWEWLVGIGQGLTVNIAGPRASKDPDVYGLAYDLLTLILLRDRS